MQKVKYISYLGEADQSTTYCNDASSEISSMSSPDIRFVLGSDTFEKFTPRQLEIIRLLAIGKSLKEIREGLVISVSTLSTHLYTIRDVLGAKDNVEAVELVLEAGDLVQIVR